MPFHISMAALGVSYQESGPTTVMIESEKANYALCTLQSNRIPQQPLDLNFTEGEEVKFFLDGNGGDVHLTGYLLETPREYEYEEEDDLDAPMTSEDDTSLTLEDEESEENDGIFSDKENDLRKEKKVKKRMKPTQDERSKVTGSKRDSQKAEIKEEKDSFNVDDDNSDDGDDSIDFGNAPSSSDVDVSLQAMLTCDLDDSDTGDDDWKPAKDQAGKKERSAKAIKKSKMMPSNKKTSQKPLSQTLINLMHMSDSTESDSEWEPGVSISKSSENTANGALTAPASDLNDSDDDTEDND